MYDHSPGGEWEAYLSVTALPHRAPLFTFYSPRLKQPPGATAPFSYSFHIHGKASRRSITRDRNRSRYPVANDSPMTLPNLYAGWAKPNLEDS